MEIDLKSKIKINELGAWMDGGSVTLYCIDKLNQEFQIHFQQNIIWEITKESEIPGRIYLNRKLIEQRSNEENMMLLGIEKANCSKLNKLEKKIIEEKILYVKSEKYLADQKKLKFYERK